MSPRRSKSESNEAGEYQTALAKICEEEDVLIVPFVRKLSSSTDVRCLTKRTTEMSSTIQSDLDREDLCLGSQQPFPPVLYVVFDRESIVTVICKSFYLEYALVRAIFSTLNIFPTIVALKIEDCCINRDIITILVTLLSNYPGKNIIDLSLDGNTEVAEELPFLLRTGIKYLSLRRCSLDDRAVKLLSKELGYAPNGERPLLALNLNMNRFGDDGAIALANALRTNRTLVSLSLSGNGITDKGASHLAEALGKFKLTQEEDSERRRRNFHLLLYKRALLQKMIDDWRARNDADVHSKIGLFERPSGRRLKSLDFGVKRMSSSRDKRRVTISRMSSREKPRSKRKTNGGENWSIFPEPSAAEMMELKLRAESEVPPDEHPFATEVSVEDSSIWCNGCWSLRNLNLSHNRISEGSLEIFLQSIAHRKEMSGHPYRGLQRLIIQPGNLIPSNSHKLGELEFLLKSLTQNLERPQSTTKSISSPTKK